MTEYTIIYASEDDSPDIICERLGIETIQKEGCKALWKYKGKIYPRPLFAQHFEDRMLEYFNMKIVYQDKNQLTMF